MNDTDCKNRIKELEYEIKLLDLAFNKSSLSKKTYHIIFDQLIKESTYLLKQCGPSELNPFR